MSELTLNASKELKRYRQEFFGILSEIVQQFLNLRRALVQAVVKRWVFNELTGCTFAVLDGRNQHGELVYRIAKFVIDGVILAESSESPLTSIDAVGDGFDACKYPVGFVVDRGIVQEPGCGTVPVLNHVNQRIDAMHHVINAIVSFIVRDQFADGSVSASQVTNEVMRFPHEGVSFVHRRIRVVIDGGVAQKSPQGSFAALHTFRHFLYIITEYLQVGDEVVCALHNFSNVALFRALYWAAIFENLARFGASRDVDSRVAKKTDGSNRDPRIRANDILICLVQAQFRFNRFLGIRHFRNAHGVDVPDRHTFQMNFRPGPEVIGILKVCDDRVFRTEESRLTADKENCQC